VASREKDLNRRKIVEGRVRWITEPAPEQATKTLTEKSGVHPSERKRVHTGTGY
jgi:hypothetical protein